MTITLLDETGLNPLPAGVRVAIYPLGESLVAGDLTAQTAVGSGGTISADLQPGTAYVAIYAGKYVPPFPSTFIVPTDGSNFSITCQSFRSTFQSSAGYAASFERVLPKKWFGSPNPATPFLDAIAAGFGTIFGILDAAAQAIRAGERLESCVGPQIDAWIRDHFNDALPRYENEPDPYYINRAVTLLSIERTTLAGILAVVNAWILSTSSGHQSPYGLSIGISGAIGIEGGIGVQPRPMPSSPNTPVQVTGIKGGLNIRGGIGIPLVPSEALTVDVFDLMTNAADSAVVGLVPGQFAVAFRFSNIASPLSVIPAYSPSLEQMVRLARGWAYLPVYCTNRP